MPRMALSCRGATADPRQPPCAQPPPWALPRDFCDTLITGPTPANQLPRGRISASHPHRAGRPLLGKPDIVPTSPITRKPSLQLWPRMAQLTFGTKYVAVEARNPLAPTRRNIEIM